MLFSQNHRIQQLIQHSSRDGTINIETHIITQTFSCTGNLFYIGINWNLGNHFFKNLFISSDLCNMLLESMNIPLTIICGQWNRSKQCVLTKHMQHVVWAYNWWSCTVNSINQYLWDRQIVVTNSFKIWKMISKEDIGI